MTLLNILPGFKMLFCGTTIFVSVITTKIVVDFCKVLPFKAGISFPMALGHSFLRFS